MTRPKGNIEVKRKQKSLFSMGPVIKVFCHNSQLENTKKKPAKKLFA